MKFSKEGNLKKKNIIEKYIEEREYFKWTLKSMDKEYLTFERDKSEGKYFKTLMKDDSFSIINILMFLPLFIFQAYNLYEQRFTDGLSNYLYNFLKIALPIIIVAYMIEGIEVIYSLLKYRVKNFENKSIYKISIKQVKIKNIVDIIGISAFMLIIIIGIFIFINK